MNRIIFAAAVSLVPLVAHTQTSADTSRKVSFAGFVDSYYAFDFNRPVNLDRSFTTQPARHNEFNVNLAHVEAVLSGGRLRGRLALQAGTSVQSNYSAEPAIGSVSGPSLSRHLQEAYVGYQITPSVWVDGGIFFSNMGMESWISRDNPTYTRSQVAEYSPYYSSGAKITWQATPKLSARLDVVNGWQNISETNEDKGAGLRLDYALSPTATFSYYNFFNNETIITTDDLEEEFRDDRLRIFNGIGAKVTVGRTTLLGQFDLGSQDRGEGFDGNSSWYGFTAVARFQVTPTVAVSGRVERFDDEDQVLIGTGVSRGFRANGASVGLDVVPHPGFLWRTELRGFSGDERVFPDRDSSQGLAKGSGFVVSSFALTF
ncbi:MAG: porin [Anaerolineae bacterium]|nr:porin [Gemmatimonadaceae bacterium]